MENILSLIDKGHTIYEIWKAPMYVRTKYGKGGGDYYTDPVLQVQAMSDTNRLPSKVIERYAPIKKLKTEPHIHRWSYGAGYSRESDIQTLLHVFKIAGYEIVRTEEPTDNFGNRYKLYYVANIGGK